MKKNLLSLLLLVGLALFMNGCVGRGYNCKMEGYNYPDNSTLSNVYIATGSMSISTPSGGVNTRSKAFHAMQMAAELTHEKGYQYFAIISPRKELSVHDGSLVNTMEEIEKCLPSAGNIWGHSTRSCGLGGTASWTSLIIGMYHEEQAEFVTFKAQDVLDYLHKNELYREDKRPKWKDVCERTQIRDARP